MLTYKNEEPIKELILANTSIAYCSPVQRLNELPPKVVQSLAAASVEGINFDTPKTDDLFYTRSILVSTSINLNGDHFHPLETWAARKTTIDKPTNINHDQGVIIGHITSQWAIDANNNLIPDDISAEEIPDFFHVANGSVIYRKFPGNDEMQAASDLLIAEISADQKFVSMECLFSNFQYAVVDGDRNFLVARNEETSFLTEHLRAYGGTGEFEGMQISRSLMNINFCGKGFVDQPANKDSIIFAKDKISQFSFANVSNENPFKRTNGVHFNCKANIGENNMADNKDQEIVELKAAVASLNKELTEAGSKALESKIDELKVEIAEASKEVEVLNDKLVKEQEAKACMCNQVDKIAAENEKLKAELAKEQEKSVLAARTEALKNKDLDEDTLESVLAELAPLDEKTFALVAKRFPDKASAEKLAPENVDDSKAEVEVEVVEEKEQKVEASVDNDDKDPAEAAMVARAALIKAVASQFETKPKEKVES